MSSEVMETELCVQVCVRVSSSRVGWFALLEKALQLPGMNESHT